MRTRRILLLAAALVMLLLPGAAARGAPEPISAADFQARIERALHDIESAAPNVPAARAELGTVWQVDGFTVDMRPVSSQLELIDPRTTVGNRSLSEVAVLLREHLRSLEQAKQTTFKPMPDARQKLNEALAAPEAQKRGLQAVIDWIGRMWRRLFSNRQPSAAAPSATANRGSFWAAVIIAVAGIGLLAWAVARNLRAQGGAGETAVRQRKAGRPDKPATPDELWQQAGREAGAGEYKEALRLAHLAMLQHLDRTGLLRFMPSGTNREHEWALRRRRPDLASTMHQLNDLVESRLYSGQDATAEDFRKGEGLAQQLWREGDAVSKSAQGPNGASSSASSS